MNRTKLATTTSRFVVTPYKPKVGQQYAIRQGQDMIANLTPANIHWTISGVSALNESVGQVTRGLADLNTKMMAASKGTIGLAQALQAMRAAASAAKIQHLKRV